jgi:large subunit ribosomal protein L9
VKVVFLQDVTNVAKAGDVKEVADGYSRNYLLPKGLAVAATPSELKKLEVQKQADARREVRTEQEAEAFAKVLQDTTVVLKMRAGTKEKLYGSVTTADIAREIKKLTKQEVDKHKIELAEPIRELGSHQVSIKLIKDITATVNVVVEQETEPEAKPEKKPEKKPAKKQAKKKETD